MIELNDDENLILKYFYQRLKDYKFYDYDFEEIWRHTNLNLGEYMDSLDKLFSLNLLHYDDYLCKLTDKGINYVEQLKKNIEIEISTK